jgi:hypothetical protein
MHMIFVLPEGYRDRPSIVAVLAVMEGDSPFVAWLQVTRRSDAQNTFALQYGCSKQPPHQKTRGYHFSAFAGHLEWAMLGSNQRPLPCEGSTIGCWRFLELAKYLQTTVFLLWYFSPAFQEIYSGCCTVAAHSPRMNLVW